MISLHMKISFLVFAIRDNDLEIIEYQYKTKYQC